VFSPRFFEKEGDAVQNTAAPPPHQPTRIQQTAWANATAWTSPPLFCARSFHQATAEKLPQQKGSKKDPPEAVDHSQPQPPTFATPSNPSFSFADRRLLHEAGLPQGFLYLAAFCPRAFPHNREWSHSFFSVSNFHLLPSRLLPTRVHVPPLLSITPPRAPIDALQHQQGHQRKVIARHTFAKGPIAFIASHQYINTLFFLLFC